MASSTQEILDRLIERRGEGALMVQVLRDQIHAEANNKSVEDTYITGGVKRE